MRGGGPADGGVGRPAGRGGRRRREEPAEDTRPGDVRGREARDPGSESRENRPDDGLAPPVHNSGPRDDRTRVQQNPPGNDHHPGTPDTRPADDRQARSGDAASPAQESRVGDVHTWNAQTAGVQTGETAPEPAGDAKDTAGDAKGGKGAGRETPRKREPRYARPLSTAALIGWTALSAVVPGAAHLRAGNRAAGFALLGTFGAALVAVAVLAVQLKNNAGAAVRGSTLTAVTIGAGVCAVAWFALIVLSFVALRPQRLSQGGQIVSGVVAGVLCVAVMAPFAFTASTIRTASDLLDAVTAPVAAGVTPVPIRAEDPWSGRKRVNFLLIGGDAAGNRIGVRTDSMTVASVNIATGNTVLLSLPRNLQYVRFPTTSPLRKQFPGGFTAEQGLLNSVWYYADNNPQIMGGKNRGAQALRDAIGYTLGLHIDYYAIVDMFGFAALIDAVGGLKIRVERDIKWGGHFGTAGTIKAGYRTLNGEEVLWYGRSRVDSDDFSRMARQRCVIGALAQQVTPATVLANFSKIAAAARHMFRTDIPRDLLEHLVPLGMKVRNAKITSLQFVPPTIYPGNPDWVKIRNMTRQAIRESMADTITVAATASPIPSGAGSPSGTTPGVSSQSSPGASAGASAGAQTSGGSSPAPSGQPPTPRRTPTHNTAAKSLSELCGL
ncbi:LCP family protein [Microbispora sp. NPDC049125]|uniref:LCP family protein n=1 Tax=Microbispora sp. NPDC049125 TaxID=3154929 RepID=UPI003466D1A9